MGTSDELARVVQNTVQIVVGLVLLSFIGVVGYLIVCWVWY